MDGRARVRTFLLGGEADRSPFLPLASDLTARLAQCSRRDLLSHPHVLTQAYLDVASVCGFECVLLEPGFEVVAGALKGEEACRRALSVLADGEERLRVLLGEGAAIGVVLPGPYTLASYLGRSPEPEDLESLGAEILATFQSLHPPILDLVAIQETELLNGHRVAAVREALIPLWNAARYYSMPTLFLAASAGAVAASVGAAAVAVLDGATPQELADAGASRVGVPVRVGAVPLPPLPRGGFYLAAEIDPAADVAAVQELVRRASRPG